MCAACLVRAVRAVYLGNPALTSGTAQGLHLTDNSTYGDQLAALRSRDLDELRWHWGEAYKISWQNNKYPAERLDDGRLIEADGPAELRLLMQYDYATRPVPRQPGPCRDI